MLAVVTAWIAFGVGATVATRFALGPKPASWWWMVPVRVAVMPATLTLAFLLLAAWSLMDALGKALAGLSRVASPKAGARRRHRRRFSRRRCRNIRMGIMIGEMFCDALAAGSDAELARLQVAATGYGRASAAAFSRTVFGNRSVQI